jgi:hypothetical protein
MGCVVYDEGSTVFGKDVLIEPVKKYISIYFHQRLAIVPGCWANKPVIGPLISPIQKVIPEPILQTTERFDTFHDICHGNPFAEILKQPVTE